MGGFYLGVIAEQSNYISKGGVKCTAGKGFGSHGDSGVVILVLALGARYGRPVAQKIAIGLL